MKKTIKEILDRLKAVGKAFIVIVLIIFVFGALYSFWNTQTAFYRTPSNANVVIPPDADLQSILPNDFGGNNYEETFFYGSQNASVWLSSCFSGKGVAIKHADNMTNDLMKAYLRKYKSYEDSNLTPFLCIQEYDTDDAARKAASSLLIEGIRVNDMDGAKIIGSDDTLGSLQYTLVAGKYLVTGARFYYPAEKMIRETIKLYKK